MSGLTNVVSGVQVCGRCGGQGRHLQLRDKAWPLPWRRRQDLLDSSTQRLLSCLVAHPMAYHRYQSTCRTCLVSQTSSTAQCKPVDPLLFIAVVWLQFKPAELISTHEGMSNMANASCAVCAMCRWRRAQLSRGSTRAWCLQGTTPLGSSTRWHSPTTHSRLTPVRSPLHPQLHLSTICLTCEVIHCLVSVMCYASREIQ